MPAERNSEAGRPSHQHPVPTRQSLTSAQKRLIDYFQRLNFGSIRGLRFSDGEPLFDPPFEIVRTVKLPGDNRPRPELGAADFPLKRELIEFFTRLAELDRGVVEVVKIQHGLPIQMDIVEQSDR